MIMITIMIRRPTQHKPLTRRAHIERFHIAAHRATNIVVLGGSMNNNMEGTNCLVTNATSRHWRVATRSLSCCQLIILFPLISVIHTHRDPTHYNRFRAQQLNSPDTDSPTGSYYILTSCSYKLQHLGDRQTGHLDSQTDALNDIGNL